MTYDEGSGSDAELANHPLIVGLKHAPRAVLFAVSTTAIALLQERDASLQERDASLQEPRPTATTDTPLIDPDLIPLGVLAVRLKRSKEGLRKWALRNGLLVKVMGRLYVRESGLRAILNKPA